MDDDKVYEQKLTKGFNDGYLLSRFDPDLYKQIMRDANKEHPYFKGMVAGQVEVQKEVFRQMLQQSRQKPQERKPKMR